jgi:hypothetical protein
VKERPILFSAPMVGPVLDGSKTQTRRVMKPQPRRVDGGVPFGDSPAWAHAEPGSAIMRCPYGIRGDRLWVRENGWERPYRSARDMREGADTWPPYEYDVEPVCCWEDGELKRLCWKRRPSIHMPRWASRITLEVTAVRVERLQSISETDAIAEGIEPAAEGYWRLYGRDTNGDMDRSARTSYRSLWESINGPGSWDANPWVWVIEFKRLENRP